MYEPHTLIRTETSGWDR